MGRLIQGQWQPHDEAEASFDGYFNRSEPQFRAWLKADGSTTFTPDLGRYHLYVSLAAPESQPVLILRKLKKLEQALSLSVLDPLQGAQGWAFSEAPACLPDTVNGASYLHQIYTAARPDYTGPVTLPLLWDKKTKTIVSNDPTALTQMLNKEFETYGDTTLNFYPPDQQEAIDEMNAIVYDKVNNGVYKCGFAPSQDIYEAAFDELFHTLDLLEERLSRQRYVVGNRLTTADWHLFATLIRFDTIYYSLFKCNLRRIIDYPELSNYVRELYQVPGVAETVNFAHIKQHYYLSYPRLNPVGIIPAGPKLNLSAPHNRDKLSRPREKTTM
jgi:putative glutathione S-transferase